MADTQAMLIEANRRGLLTGDKKAAFDAAVERGIIAPADTFRQQEDFNKSGITDVPDPSLPQQPDITSVPQPPFGVSYNLFRGAKTGADIATNAKQMGFDLQKTADGGVLMKRGDEVYRYDPDSMWSGLISAIRPTAQSIGNVAGAVLSTPEAAATGPLAPAVVAAGSTLGGTAGGAAVDALVGLAEPRGTTLAQEAGQSGQDLVEQGKASLLGDITGRVIGKAVNAGKGVTARASEAMRPRIEPTIGADINAPTTSAPAASEATYQKLVDNIKANKVKKAATAVRPDLGLKKVAEEEGIYLNPSHYSKNPVYVETEQAMKSRPGSMLNAREQSAIVRMGEVADEIKTSIGGYTDKSQLNSDYTQKIFGTMDAMRKQESQLYDQVSAAAPKGTKVNPKNTIAYLQGRADELGGFEYLTGEEKRIWSRVQSGKVNLALLDETRKQVGAGYQKQGPFRDAEGRLLDNLYGAMTRDQEGVARVFGVDDVYQLAKKTTADRKSIEEGISAIYKNSNVGSGLDLPLAARLDSAVMGLTKGNVNDFRKVVQMVPKDMRQSAVATSLDSIFTNGARNKNNSIGQGFIAGYESLQKNAAARRELNAYLPVETQDRMDSLYRVAKGIYSAKRWENTSGTARAMLANMDKDASAFQKLYDFGRKAGAAEAVGNAVGMPGAGTVMTVATALNAATKTPASKAADAMIAGPAFEDAIKEYAAGRQGAATTALIKSKPYQEWLSAQPKSNRMTIGAGGIFSFLFGRQTTEQPPLEEQPSSQ